MTSQIARQFVRAVARSFRPLLEKLGNEESFVPALTKHTRYLKERTVTTIIDHVSLVSYILDAGF